MKTVILIIGASGTGKDSAGKELEKLAWWKGVKSYTTRPPRFEGEDTHTFISDEEYDKLTDIVAYTEFNGYRYCATAEQIATADYYIIDPEGGERMMREWHNPDVELVPVLLEASEETRANRMLFRGDSVEDIERRIQNDRIAFAPARTEFIHFWIDSDNFNAKEVAEQIITIKIENYYKEELN